MKWLEAEQETAEYKFYTTWSINYKLIYCDKLIHIYIFNSDAKQNQKNNKKIKISSFPFEKESIHDAYKTFITDPFIQLVISGMEWMNLDRHTIDYITTTPELQDKRSVPLSDWPPRVVSHIVGNFLGWPFILTNQLGKG